MPGNYVPTNSTAAFSDLLDLGGDTNPVGGNLEKRTSADQDAWLFKRIVLVRHGRSQWNEFLGAHKKKCWDEQEKNRKGLRGAFKNISGAFGSKEGSSSKEDVGKTDERESIKSDATHMKSEASMASCVTSSPSEWRDSSPNQSKQGFWKGVRGGIKHVGNAIGQAEKLKKVDHGLSIGGIAEARQLRKRIASLLARSTEITDGPESALLECNTWYVSPFCRALQTAAFGVSPLQRYSPHFVIRVTPLLNEFCTTSGSLDCQGKRGNVGLRIVTRAMAKTLELLDEADEEKPSTESFQERHAELAETSAVFTSMDLAEVMQMWWQEKVLKKEEMARSDDLRVRQMVARLLHETAATVGCVGHSLFFKRLLQLFWPKEPRLQEEFRAALRNGASPDTKDPYHDKIVNCGVLVLSWKYKPCSSSWTTAEICNTAELTAAHFLFDGRMEDSLSQDLQTLEDHDLYEMPFLRSDTLSLDSFGGELPQLEAFLEGSPPREGYGHS